LNGVSRPNPLTASNLCIPLRRFRFGPDQFDRALGKEVELTLFEDRVATIRHIVEVMLREVATLPAPIPWATLLLNTS